MLDVEQEKDPEVLRQVARLALADNARLVQRIVRLTEELARLKHGDQQSLALEIEKLKEELATLQKQLYGRKSERRPRGSAKGETEDAPRTGHGPKPQPELERVVEPHTLDEADQVCPSCGGALEPWEGQAEESEEVDVIERKFVIRVHRRQKYHCACGGHVETALGPTKLIPGGRYSLGFAVEVAADKYGAHLPLERQVKLLKQAGLDVDSQTLWDQLYALVRTLRPVYQAIGQHVLAAPVVFADETPWRMLLEKESGKWFAWGVSRWDAAYYAILDSRATRAGKAVLGSYRGTMVCDGYPVYPALARSGPKQRSLEDDDAERAPPAAGDIVIAGCWAHARRKVVEAEPYAPDVSREAIDLIGELYLVERQVPFEAAEGEDALKQLGLRAELREKLSKPIVEKILAWAEATKSKVLPQSKIGRAAKYIWNQRKPLQTFLADPRVPIDNNAAERALRGVVLGRKNYYGSKSERGAEAAAVLYTIIESCKLCDVNPKAYLKHVALSLLQSGERPPLPHEWAQRVKPSSEALSQPAV